MFDGIEPRPGLIDRMRAWIAASEYSIAERAVAWIAAAAVIWVLFHFAQGLV